MLIGRLLQEDDDTDVYIQTITSWWQADYEKMGKPESHPFLTAADIPCYFHPSSVFLTLADNKLIAYIIYCLSPDQTEAQLVYVEVEEGWRWKGIFSKFMLPTFLQSFPAVSTLIMSVDLERHQEAALIFIKCGWTKTELGFSKIISEQDRIVSIRFSDLTENKHDISSQDCFAVSPCQSPLSSNPIESKISELMSQPGICTFSHKQIEPQTLQHPKTNHSASPPRRPAL